MTFKRLVSVCLAFCIMAILGVAICGCDDLGAYEDPEEYYNSFGDIVLIDGATKDSEEYSVEEYFYNKESREDFLEGEDGAYQGVEFGDYVYMAIPFESNIDMDTLALFVRSQDDVTVYINVFVSDDIPSAWRAISDNEISQDGSGDASDEEADTETDTETEEPVYDDPDAETRIGEIVVHLKKGKWSSFVLDEFNLNGKTQKSIQIKDGQYILLQFRNNSGVRFFDEEKQIFVDPQTALELPTAKITMTNLLIRALDIKNGDEVQEGD